MIDKLDLMSGIHYLEMSSKPREEKKESTLGLGMTIIGGFFLCMMAIVIAI